MSLAGLEAAALEVSTGIPVLRHAAKKPAGGSEELESHFGCPSSQLLMVGDRYLTDIVFGNRHGMMTVRPTPLVLEGEPAGVVVVSSEISIKRQWCRWERAMVRHPRNCSPPLGMISRMFDF